MQDQLERQHGPDDECTVGIGMSGKGGTGKSWLQWMLASAASTEGIPALLIDLDPEANLTNALAKNAFPQLRRAPGIGDVFVDAGALWAEDGEDYEIEPAAAKLRQIIVPSTLPGVDFIPAGRQLHAVGQAQLRGRDWGTLLRRLLEAAGLRRRYRLILIDTAGRRGPLVTEAMYAADVAYSPINANDAAITKALEARERVFKIQEAHSLRWAGVVITGIDTSRNTAANVLIRRDALHAFGATIDPETEVVVEPGEVIAEVPYRPASLHEAFLLMERVSDRPGRQALDSSRLLSALLHEHILRSAPLPAP